VGEACAHRLAGHLDLARSTLERAIPWSVEYSQTSLLAGSLHTGLADILRERNELDAALERATQGISLMPELGAAGTERWIEWQVCNLLVLARIKQAQGDLEGALAAVRERQERLADVRPGSWSVVLAAFEAQLHLARGDVDSAVRWLRGLGAGEGSLRVGVTPQVVVYLGEHLEIAPVQVLIAQGAASGDAAALHRALALLDRLQKKAERSELVWLQAKALVLTALARRALGEVEAARSALDQALALAQPGGHMRLFLDEGPAMADLLRERRADSMTSDYAAALLVALENRPERGRGKAARLHGGEALRAALPEPLTERESEVLRLLAVGQSNPEIARTLYLEVNTIKTHLKRLYGKLGVHNRVQAVLRARQLGIL
jgi:LuxR family maltose regulon positive regulatory protein